MFSVKREMYLLFISNVTLHIYPFLILDSTSSCHDCYCGF